MKVSVCIDALYAGQSVTDAMREIKSLGYTAYEFWSWWDKDLTQIAALQKQLHLTAAAFCTKMISLVDPSKREAYLDGLSQSIEVCKLLSCKTLITQVGDAIPSLSREEQQKNLIEGLKSCIPLLEKGGIVLTVEPLNQRDHAGYYLSSSQEAFSIVKQVNHPNIKILYDVYHQQVTQGDVIRDSTENRKWIGHMHAAGNPGRHELSRGELNYPQIFSALEDAGYDGFMGLEYFPLQPVRIGLKQVLERNGSSTSV